MATILSAVRDKAIDEYGCTNPPATNVRRKLYLAADLFKWIDETPALYVEKWSKDDGGRSRAEHLEQAFKEYIYEDRPLVGDLDRVTPTKHGVWTIHCNGLRIYGWIAAPQDFVAVAAAFTEQTHGKDSIVPQKVQEVLDFAKAHGLSGAIQLGDRLALFPPKT